MTSRLRFILYSALAFLLLAGCTRLTPSSPDDVAPPLVLTEGADVFDFGDHMDVLLDPSGGLTIDDVTTPWYAEQFRRVSVPAPNFGFTPAAVWLRLPVHNTVPQRQVWYVRSLSLYIDTLTLYRPTPEGGYDASTIGRDVPFNEWEVREPGAFFESPIAPGQEHVYYLRLASQGRVDAPLQFVTDDGMHRITLQNQLLLGFAIGVLIILLLYNILLGAWQRDLDNLLLAAFIAASLFRGVVGSGMLERVVWPNVGGLYDVLNPLSVAIFAICLLAFTDHFLSAGEQSPGFRRALLAFVGVFSLTALWALLGDRRPVTIAQFVLIPTSSVLIIAATYRLYRSGSASARYYLLAVAPALVLVSLEMIGAFTLPSVGILGDELVTAGMMLAALALSIIVATRVAAARRQALEANSRLEESNRRLAEANEQVEQARARYAMVLNDQAATVGRFQPDGTILIVNQAFCLVYGGTPESHIGRNIFTYYPASRVDVLMKAIRSLTPASPTRTFELSVDRDGTTRWRSTTVRAFFDENGQAVEYQWTGTDITEARLKDEELQRQKAALEESRAQYAAVLNDQVETLTRFDRDGRLTFVNRAFCDFYGGTPESHVGASIYDGLRPEVVLVLTEKLAAVTPEEAFATAEVVVDDQFGRERWRRLRVRGLFDENACLTEYQATGLDITEERRKDEELRQYREELERLVEARTAELTQANRELSRQTRIAASLRHSAYALNRSLNLQDVLDTIIDEIKLVRPNEAVVRILFAEDGYLAIHASDGLDRSSHISHTYDLDDWRWPGVRAFHTGEVVLNNDLYQNPEWPGREMYPDWRSAIALPLSDGDSRLGVLICSSHEPDAYANEDVKVLKAFAGHASLAIANAQRYEASKAVATAAERERLSRDLHDSVTQTLFSASLIAQALPLQMRKDPTAGEANAEKLAVLTRGALGEMRALLVELRPTLLTVTDLRSLLGFLCNAAMARARLEVTLEVNGEPVDLPPDVQITFYRVAQEALNNVIKHAKARRVSVLLWYRVYEVALQVRDDGMGFDPLTLGAGTLGMSSMRERAEAIGARLDVSAAPGRGAEVCLAWKARD